MQEKELMDIYRVVAILVGLGIVVYGVWAALLEA